MRGSDYCIFRVTDLSDFRGGAFPRAVHFLVDTSNLLGGCDPEINLWNSRTRFTNFIRGPILSA